MMPGSGPYDMSGGPVGGGEGSNNRNGARGSTLSAMGMGMGMGYHGYQLPPGLIPSQSMGAAAGGPPAAAMRGGLPAGMAAMPVMAGAAGATHHAPAMMTMDPSHGVTREFAPEKSRSDLHMITFHPPGMPRAFEIPFPERRLPVCDRCKKNYKSRDLCRTRDGHRTLPWTTTYIAITVDPSLIVSDPSDGSLSFADLPVQAEICEVPLMCLGPSDGSMKHEPICKVCREKNYTRDYCRNTCKHTTPPWSCTYIKIAADMNPNSDALNGKGSMKKRKKNGDEYDDGSLQQNHSAKKRGGKKGMDYNSVDAYSASHERSEEDESLSHDLTQIHLSRTFLASVSSKSVIVRWCEEIQYPPETKETIPQQMPGMEAYFSMHQHGAGAGAGGDADSHQMLQMRAHAAATKDKGTPGGSDGAGQGGAGNWPGGGSEGAAANANNPMAAMMGMGGGAGSMSNMFNNSNSTMQNNQLWEAFRAGAMWAQAQGGQIPGGYGPYGGGMGAGGMPSNPMAFFAQSQAAAGGGGAGGPDMQDQLRWGMPFGGGYGMGRGGPGGMGGGGGSESKRAFQNKNPGMFETMMGQGGGDGGMYSRHSPGGNGEYSRASSGDYGGSGRGDMNDGLSPKHEESI